MREALTDILSNDLGVRQSYRHTPKRATPGDSIETNGAVLKWYALHRDNEPVSDEIDQLARSYLARNILEAKGLGFVILHRCGNDFYFLIVNTWRGNFMPARRDAEQMSAVSFVNRRQRLRCAPPGSTFAQGYGATGKLFRLRQGYGATSQSVTCPQWLRSSVAGVASLQRVTI